MKSICTTILFSIIVFLGLGVAIKLNCFFVKLLAGDNLPT